MKIWRSLRFRFLPRASVNTSGNVRHEQSFDVDSQTRALKPRLGVDQYTLTGSGDVTYEPIYGGGLTSRVNYKTGRQLYRGTRRPTLADLTVRRETSHEEGANLSYRAPFWQWLSPQLSFDTRYTEDRRNENEGRLNVQNTNGTKVTVQFRTQDVLQRAGIGGRAGRNDPRPGARRPQQQPRGDGGEGEGGGEEGSEEGDEAPADSAAVEEGGPSPLAGVLTGFEFLVTRLRDISGSYNLDKTSRFDRVKDRPDLSYRFGVTTRIADELKDDSITNRSENRTVRTTLSFDSGLDLLADLKLDGRYRRTASNTVNPGSEQTTLDLSWPDLTFTWSNFGRRFGLQEVFPSSTLRSGVRRRSNERRVSATGDVTVQRELSFDPLLEWSLGWKGGARTTITARYATESDESRRAEVLSSRTEGTDRSLGITMSYKARNLRLPFMAEGSGLTFKSQVDLSMNIRYSANEEKNTISGVTIRKARELDIRPEARYNFSRNVNGSARAEISRRWNDKEGTKRQILGLFFECAIRF
jgi:hypothetical protein